MNTTTIIIIMIITTSTIFIMIRSSRPSPSSSTQVSAMTKIVPSPDWFVGLDSLQLCKDGHFIQTYATEVNIIHIHHTCHRCQHPGICQRQNPTIDDGDKNCSKKHQKYGIPERNYTNVIMSCSGQVFPLDAGTDNGFTFTSPNWETEPRAEVVAIFKFVIIAIV